MGKQSWRIALLASAAATATSFASAAFAQNAAPAAAPLQVAQADTTAPDSSVAAVVVTGTRLQASGFTTPTPVTVTSNVTIEDRGKMNIADALNENPSFQPSSGPSQATRNFTGTLGFSTVDLRGLGANRTLVLVDGRRFVPIAPSGVVDVSVIPTNLVDRVETVTGGASAQYGSDAVAGVVNFILRDRLEGIRANALTGTSEHGGNQEWGANIAVGHGFMDNKLHVIAGLDWSENLGISNQYKRDWGKEEAGYVGLTTRPAGTPANVLCPGEHFSNMTPGGIITTGPLKGTAFGPGGVPYQWNYGPLAGPSFQCGGDGYGYEDSSIRNLEHPTSRLVSLGRINYDLTPNVTLYVEGSYAREHVHSQGAELRSPDPIVITLNNPFLPAATRAAVLASGSTYSVGGVTGPGFVMGRYTTELGIPTNESVNQVSRGVIGAKGTIFGNWKWDVYAESGQTITHSDYYNASSTRLYQALNAVVGPNGTPVCGDITKSPYFLSKDATRRQQILNTTDATQCVAFNPFGFGAPSAAALAYIRTHFDQRIITTQNEAQGSVSGSPFNTWAGPVEFAFGAEGRRDAAKQDADNFGINASNDGVNFTPLDGAQTSYEFFGETGIPLLKDSPLGKSLDFNGAVRETHYQYSGWVTTWKVGGVYKPTDWLMVRATESRDIRAPHITDLFQIGAANGLAITNPTNGATASVPVLINGNPNLSPEVASTFTGGFVLTPRGGWFSNLSLSVDYFHIDVKGIIGSISGTDVVNRYFNLHQTQYASFFAFDSSNVGFSRITETLQNLTELLNDGVDMVATYRVPIEKFNLPGRFAVQANVTWENRSATIDNTTGKMTVTNNVGYSIPRWRTNVTFNYDIGKFSTSLQERSFGGMEINRALVGPDSPAYNPASSTSVNYNHSPGLVYWNLSARYDVIRKGDQQLQVFGVIDNLFDKDPPISALALTGNGGLEYDFIGRNFKVGVRYVMP